MAYVFDEKNLIAQIDNFIKENKEDIIQDIKTLVNIPSVESESEPNAPFGVHVNSALLATLEMANGMNLSTTNMQGYFGYADLKGKSEKQIAAISHLDVVPAGNGWTHDAFDCIEKDGYLIGRGVYDDKGPAVLSLYAAKFFAQKGEKLPYTLRILLGTNEESGMKCLEHYLKHEKPPEFCFTPDGNFPLGFAEKGIYGGVLKSGVLNGNLLEFTGGVATNVVPDRAIAIVKMPSKMPKETENIELEQPGDGTLKIKAFGIGGHASIPENTLNAIGVATKFMLDNNLVSQNESEFLQMLYHVISDVSGKNAGISASDDIFTPLTCVGGTIIFKNNVLIQTFNIRYPTTITAEQITQRFSEAASRAGASFTKESAVVPFVTAKDSEEVIALCKTYNEVTGKNEQPFSMGGGTYARHFPRAVSFGPEEKDEVFPDFVGPIHGANEGASINSLMQALKIYILGIARLMQIVY